MYTHFDGEFYPELQDRSWKQKPPIIVYGLLMVCGGFTLAMLATTWIISPLFN